MTDSPKSWTKAIWTHFALSRFKFSWNGQLLKVRQGLQIPERAWPRWLLESYVLPHSQGSESFSAILFAANALVALSHVGMAGVWLPWLVKVFSCYFAEDAGQDYFIYGDRLTPLLIYPSSPLKSRAPLSGQTYFDFLLQHPSQHSLHVLIPTQPFIGITIPTRRD